MKQTAIWVGVIVAINFAAVGAASQQTFTQIVTSQNKSCNNQCTVIDLPALNGNPNAIFIVAQVTGNASPIGAYYMYQNKWSIFNLNTAAMPVGARFDIEYYPTADATHFVFIVPKLVHSNDDIYIDRAGLNNNPGAQVRVLPTNPTAGNAIFDPGAVLVIYVSSESKWLIRTVNGGTLTGGTAYNVVFSSGGPVISNPAFDKNLNTKPKIPTSDACNCALPDTLPPSGSAGGDLVGSYPGPMVQGLQGKPVSASQPTMGQVLRWSGSAWEPFTEASTTNAVATTPFQTFLKIPTSSSSSTPVNTPALVVIPDLTQVITLAKRSRLIMSAFVGIRGPNCSVACGGSGGNLFLQINDEYFFSTTFAVPDNGFTNVAVSNYMRDLDPGTYSVKFGVSLGPRGIPISATPNQSSIIVVPL